jgi:hypothetical protein
MAEQGFSVTIEAEQMANFLRTGVWRIRGFVVPPGAILIGAEADTEARTLTLRFISPRHPELTGEVRAPNFQRLGPGDRV